MNDTIQQVISARASELGLTAYAVAKRCEITPEAVKRFLEGRAALNSRYVSRICEVLDLELRAIPKSRRKSTERPASRGRRERR